ncbi:MAG: hypothetical protein GQ569_09305 [Methylococcaceae bacterium]|nr:hypothetical protein [Methylococcaceae bacterium]
MSNPFIQEDNIHLSLPNKNDRLLDFDGVVHPAPKKDITALWRDIEPLVGTKVFFT